MSASRATKNRVRTFVVELDFAPEPIALFDQLTQTGQIANTLLLESADIVTRRGEKSLIVARAAVKATCRGNKVVLDALTPQGEHALDNLSDLLATHVVSKQGQRVHLDFPKPVAPQSLADRLRAPSSLDVLRAMTKGFSHDADAPPGTFLAAGIFSYDLIDQIELLPPPKRDELDFPDYLFWLTEILIVIDHRRHKTHLIQHVFDDEPSVSAEAELADLATACREVHARPHFVQNEDDVNAAMSFSVGDLSDVSDHDFAQMVSEVKNRIVAGDVFQIVPSRTFKMPCVASLAAYQKLRAFNPSPYMYFIVDNEFTLMGASPETFIKVTGPNKTVEVRPIAGTRRRGIGSDGKLDLDLDARKEAELRLDRKELAEHMMLVDLARNDVARVSKPKTRYVEKLLSVDRYSHVMHLVSCVRGELRADLDALHAYQASMNMGTLVGAPKVKAAEILRKIEKTKRGFYGGAVGYIDRDGNMDTAIVIRSALIQDGKAHVRSGAGVVYDSIPEDETNETKSKAEAVLRAIALANNDKMPQSKPMYERRGDQ